MREIKRRQFSDKTDVCSVLSAKDFFKKLKKYFIPWLIAAMVLAAAVLGYSITINIINGQVSVLVNFSYDGIEAGMDPLGNKFDVNEIKSRTLIEKCLDDLGMSEADPEAIYNNIAISGLVPSDVIDRITSYTPVYDSDEIVSSKNIQDSTYYPTQYSIELDCRKAGLSRKDSVLFLNRLTEEYSNQFFENYGYNKSLENAVISIDYNDYDYVDAVSVFDSSLKSLKEYIDDLAKHDNIRFRSEQSGYTFADLSQSIETIRTEDLDMILSYIVYNNVTKDKENLIANYEFKIEELTRSKNIYKERLQSINDTISNYEKNSILIFGNATDGSNATLNQSSDTYDNMIDDKVRAETNLSTCEQNISLYENRIQSLKSGTQKSGVSELVEKDFEKLNNKIHTMLEAVNITATEYFEEVLFSNAYKILSPATESVFYVIKSSVKDSVNIILAIELILMAAYLVVSAAAVYIPYDNIISNIKKHKKRKGGKRKNG